MKKQILLLSAVMALSSLSHHSFAQVAAFQKTFGDTVYDYGLSVEQTNDKGYVMTGYAYGFGAGGSDYYVVKTDSESLVLWTKTYGGMGDDFGRSIRQTADGGYIIAGATTSFGAGGYDVYLVKTDMNGDTVWTKTFGNGGDNVGYCAVQTRDGGYIVTGTTGTDVYLVKTNSAGDTLWTKAYGGPGADYGTSVQQTEDSGYVITGYTNSFGAGNNDAFLVKTDVNGNLSWGKTYGGTMGDQGSEVVQTIDGGYVIAGNTMSFGQGQEDMYLIKTNGSGTVAWSKAYGGTMSEMGLSLTQTEDGGYLAGGNTYSFGINGDVYLVRADTNGAVLWSQNLGGSSFDYGHSIRNTVDGGFVVGGYTMSFGSGGHDYYLLKTDENGVSGCYDAGSGTIETVAATQTTNFSATLPHTASISTTPSTIMITGGKETIVCTNVGIKELPVYGSFLISPNPSAGKFTISLNGFVQNASLSIFNSLGEKIYSESFSITTEEKKDISLKAAAGIYFVQIGDGEKVYMQKMIIQ